MTDEKEEAWLITMERIDPNGYICKYVMTIEAIINWNTNNYTCTNVHVRVLGYCVIYGIRFFVGHKT